MHTLFETVGWMSIPALWQAMAAGLLFWMMCRLMRSDLMQCRHIAAGISLLLPISTVVDAKPLQNESQAENGNDIASTVGRDRKADVDEKLRVEMEGLFKQLYAGMFTRQLERELDTLKTRLSLTDEQVVALKESAADAIRTVTDDRAKRMAATGKRGASVSQIEVLPREISDAVLNRLGKFVDRKQLDDYRSHVQTRLAIQKGHALQGLVVALDFRLAMLNDQREGIRKLLDSHWKDAWTISGGHTSHKTPGLPNDLPLTELNRLLTESQKHALNNLLKTADYPTGLEGFGPTSDQATLDQMTDRFRAELTQAVRLQSESIGRLCSLSDSQEKKLTVLAKKVGENLVSERVSAQQRVQAALKNRRPDLVDRTDIYLVAHSASALLPTYERWGEMVLGVLDDNQDTPFRQLHAARTKNRNEAILLHIAAGLDTALDLSDDQLIRLSRLLAKAAPSDVAMEVMSLDLQNCLLSIPEDEYIATIGEVNWQSLKSQINETIRRLKAMRQGGRPRRARPPGRSPR